MYFGVFPPLPQGGRTDAPGNTRSVWTERIIFDSACLKWNKPRTMNFFSNYTIRSIPIPERVGHHQGIAMILKFRNLNTET
jgi:hypothetical protein